MNIQRIPMTDKAVAYQVDYSMGNLPSNNDIENFIQEALADGYDYVFEKSYFNDHMGACVSYKPNVDEINFLYDNPETTRIGVAKNYPFGKGMLLKTINQTVSNKNPVVVRFIYRGPAYFLMRCADHVYEETALLFNGVKRVSSCPLNDRSIFVMLDELYLDYNGRDKVMIRRIIDENKAPDAGDKFLNLQWPKFSSAKKIVSAFEDMRIDINIDQDMLNINNDHDIEMDPGTTDLLGYRNRSNTSNPITRIQKISLY